MASKFFNTPHQTTRPQDLTREDETNRRVKEIADEIVELRRKVRGLKLDELTERNPYGLALEDETYKAARELDYERENVAIAAHDVDEALSTLSQMLCAFARGRELELSLKEKEEQS